MAKICLCLTASTIKRNLEIVNKYRNFADIVELRVDCLDPDERLGIRHFPKLAEIPTILTIRRTSDGGRFTSGEGVRIKLLAQGLAYAEADSRQNFAYVDLEDDLRVPGLEEAARAFGTKIIRSYHNIHGMPDDIPGKTNSMRHVGDELIKIAVTVKTTADALKVFRASKADLDESNAGGKGIILSCMGHYGHFSRILAEKFGSFLSYANALQEEAEDAAAGAGAQSSGAETGLIDVQELAELYRFRKISKDTKIYGIIGNPIRNSLKQWFFNTVFGMEEMNAVYAPFPTDSLHDFMELAGELDIQGLSVAAPYKEAALRWIKPGGEANNIGTCNTIKRSGDEWLGFNTDVYGFSQSILDFLGRKNLKRHKITVIGAGGSAKAVAHEIYRLGGKALILNRSQHKAMAIAGDYGFRWGGLDAQGQALMKKYSDIVIQTTNAGMEGCDIADIITEHKFNGKELVMDLVYKPLSTPFLERTAAAGCRTINGFDMFIHQACQQYTRLTGKDFPVRYLQKIRLDRG
ncbi:MAG: type I 3-dehydroquinate dehydratase, partial [Spirochaetes bacterium]|nr:type I 3-dehydroquinate dehydratase [Spirochaetota bacterium]